MNLTLNNIKTAIALFIMRVAAKLADWIQPPNARWVFDKKQIDAACRPMRDRSVDRVNHRFAESVNVNVRELAKAIATAEPVSDDIIYDPFNDKVVKIDRAKSPRIRVEEAERPE